MTIAPPSRRGPINDGWLSFGMQLAEHLCPKWPATEGPHPNEVRALWRRRPLHRLLTWLTRPLPDGAGNSATDAATRLEILTRGGFPR